MLGPLTTYGTDPHTWSPGRCVNPIAASCVNPPPPSTRRIATSRRHAPHALQAQEQSPSSAPSPDGFPRLHQGRQARLLYPPFGDLYTVSFVWHTAAASSLNEAQRAHRGCRFGHLRHAEPTLTPWFREQGLMCDSSIRVSTAGWSISDLMVSLSRPFRTSER